MYIFGDIGNSETKVFLVNSKNKIIRNTNFSSKKMNNKVLNQKFKYLVKDSKSINKILFCSVVPKSFNLIKKFLSKKIKKRCYEIKDLKEDMVSFSEDDMKIANAKEGDLVYIQDSRWWLGGLKSIHATYDTPHKESGIVYISQKQCDSGMFIDGLSLKAEKEM